MNVKKYLEIFSQVIEYYHILDDVNQPINNPFEVGTIEQLAFDKNWIDCVQWHLEDIIRDPSIDAQEALKIKRRIDKSNQERTDLVERIDDWYLTKYSKVVPNVDAGINTESPAWVVDRLSILALKIYHMMEQVERGDVSQLHKQACQNKLQILLEQETDLSNSLSELLDDIESGTKIMKVYRQMKMYDDESLNPILYSEKQKHRCNIYWFYGFQLWGM